MENEIENLIKQIPHGRASKISLKDVAKELDSTPEDVMFTFKQIEKTRTIKVQELIAKTILVTRNY